MPNYTDFVGIINKQLDAEKDSAVITKFQNVRDAVLFGIHSSHSYFPVQGKVIRISFDSDFIRHFNSLYYYKDVLKNRKYVCLQDFSAVRNRRKFRGFEKETLELSNRLEKDGINTDELIVTFTGGEDFYGIMGAFALREEGYIVFPEACLDGLDIGLPGVPDLIAGKLGDFQNRLITSGVIANGGFLAEIDMLDFVNLNKKKEVSEIPEEALAIEVEPEAKRASGGRKQIRTYLSPGLFNNGILVCTGRIGDERYYGEHGFMTWDSQGNLITYFSKEDFATNKHLLLDIAKRVVAFTLIKNIKITKFDKFDEYNFSELVKNVCNSPHLMEEML